MGCGGSKQQDVATGNTVGAGELSRKEAAASESKASSSTTTSATSADGCLESAVETAETAETNGGLEGDEKSTTDLTVVRVVEEEQLATNETPNEFLSPREDGEVVEAEAGGEEADYALPSEDRDGDNVVEGNGMEKELKESEKKVEEEEKQKELKESEKKAEEEEKQGSLA